MRVLRNVLLLCVVPLIVFILYAKRTWPDLWNENYLYLTQERSDAALSLDDLSNNWTEKTIYEHFQSFPINCTNAMSSHYDRACRVDVKSMGEMPALTVTFFFKESRLNQAFIHVPGWRHQSALDYLNNHYGLPAARSYSRGGRHALLGWELPDGSAVYFNEKSDINPLQWSTALWFSATQCNQRGGCFLKGRR